MDEQKNNPHATSEAASPKHNALPQTSQWMSGFSERDKMQIAHASEYARRFSDAGIPGHSHIIMVARLAKKLDDQEFSANNPLGIAAE